VSVGTQQINASHPNALTYGIDCHRLKSVSHFAMCIGLFSALASSLQQVWLQWVNF